MALPNRVYRAKDVIGSEVLSDDPVWEVMFKTKPNKVAAYLVFEKEDAKPHTDSEYILLRLGYSEKAGSTYGVFGSTGVLPLEDLIDFVDDDEMKKWLLQEWYF